MTSPTKPVFSLIVPTMNRTDELRLLFVSLHAQTFKDFEVIIVDQNAGDDIVGIINEYAGILKLVHIRQQLKGASRARNAGRASATGSIITFPDDDSEYPDDLLEKVHKIFSENKDLGGITLASKSKYSDGAITRFSKTGGPINKFNILKRIVEFTIFMRADVAKDMYFDEGLGPGAETQCWSDEGPDLVLRMINKGVKFVFFPELFVYHPNPIKIYNEKTLMRSHKYGRGRGTYLKKHNYPMWFVFYVWGLYVAGIMIGLFQMNWGKVKYYYYGLKGRVEGYIQ